jgi:5-methylcytosine-specific restriction endonuclease McrA
MKKLCKKCFVVKSVGDFHKDKGMKDGYKNYCRDCYKNKIYSYGEKKGEEKRKEYEKKGFNPNSGKKGFIKQPKPLVTIDGIEGKECNRCREWKPLKDYYKFRRLAYGLDLYCKKCNLADRKQYFKTNRGKNNAHRAREKRRSREKGVKYLPFDRKKILRRDKYTCQNCGIKVHDRSTGNWNTPDKAHLDHIVSLHDGGETREENLWVLCRTCNLEKGAKSFGEAQLTLF